MTGPAPQSLIVGYDGSEPARAAVEYAADRIGPGRPVVVIPYLAVREKAMGLS